LLSHWPFDFRSFFGIVCLVFGAVLAITVAIQSPEKDAIPCLLCKTFIEQIDDSIIDPTNEEAVADALKEICGVLFPNDIDKQNNCKNVIDNALPQIIETIVNNYGDPNAICTSLTLCP